MARVRYSFWGFALVLAREGWDGGALAWIREGRAGGRTFKQPIEMRSSQARAVTDAEAIVSAVFPSSSSASSSV